MVWLGLQAQAHAQLFTPIVQEAFYPLALKPGAQQNQFSLAQDSYGFVMVGVNDGLVRFDGQHHRAVYFAPRDKGYVLSQLRHATSGQLFVRTGESFGRVQSYLGDSLVYAALTRHALQETFYLGRQGQLANNNYQLFADPEHVYYQTENALRRWLVNEAQDERLAAIASDVATQGWFVLGTQAFVLVEGTGLCRVQGGKLVPMPVFRGLAEEQMLHVAPFNTEYVVATMASGKVYFIGKDKYHRLALSEDANEALAGARITATVVSGQHIILCTQGRGCIFLKKDLNTPALDYVLRDHNGLPDNYVHHAMVDSDGRLWLAHTNALCWVQLGWPVQFLHGVGPDVNALRFYQGRLFIAKSSGLYVLGAPKGTSVESAILSQLQAKRAPATTAQMGSRPPSVVQGELNRVQYQIADISRKEGELSLKKKTAARQKQLDQYARELANLKAKARQLEEEKNLYARAVQSQETYAQSMQEMQAELRKRRQAVSTNYFSLLAGSEGLPCLDLVEVSGLLLCATEKQIVVYSGTQKKETLKYGANRLLASKRYPGRVYVVQNDRVGYMTLDNGKWTYHLNMDPGKGSIEMSTLPRGSKDAAINSIVEDAQGLLWLGCGHGVFYLNPDQGVGGRYVPTAASINKSAAVYGSGGHIIAVSQRSAYKLKGMRFQRSADLVQAVDLAQPQLYFDGPGTLWSIKGNTLYRLKATAEDWALQESLALPMLLRTQRQMTGDGKHLYFVANSGIARLPIQAEMPKLHSNAGQVRLLWVRAYTRHEEESGFQRIASEDYTAFGYDPGFRLELAFAVPGYDLAGGDAAFEYRLHADGTWKPLQTNVLDLDFKPGTYEIAIRAKDAKGQWGTPAVYRFELAPPFYQRWSFLIPMALLVVGLIFFATRRIEQYQRRVLVRRNEELEAKVAERTEALQAEQQAVMALNSELMQQKTELEIKNQQIAAQRETIAQQERKAALGEIAPSMAHEINSPLGAIQSATENIRNTLPPALQQLPFFVSRLSPELQQRFWQLLQQLMGQGQNLTISQERQAVQALESQLQALGLADARAAAQACVKGGYQGEAELLLPFLQGDDNARQLPEYIWQLGGLFKQLNLIQASSKKAQRIIESLKDAVYQRPDASIPVAVNLPHNLETILTLYDYHLRQGVVLHLDVADNLPEVEAYPEELHQVWTNLLMNAIYAMKNNGELHIRMQALPAAVRIDFADNGPGIPQHIVDRVFEPMFTTKPQGEGTGLGLSIVRKIIEEKHHGSIRVVSQPGQTVFTIELPLVQPPKATAVPADTVLDTSQHL
jgi:signal transduction histidine kinase